MSEARTRGRGEEAAGAAPAKSPRLRASGEGVRPEQVDSKTFQAASLTPAAREHLTHLLLGKLAFEVLFVVALAAAFHYVTFNPYFRGALDRADAFEVSGWAVDDSDPDARVEVQLYLDGRFTAAGVADHPRPDVRDAGRARDERHGFSFETPPLAPGEHEARVYAVHASGGGTRRVLRQIGHAPRFRVEAKGAGR